MSEPASAASQGDLGFFRFEDARGPGRRSIKVALVAVAALCLLAVVGWFVLDRYGPATVDVHGTWALEQVEKDGRLVLTAQDLSGRRVRAQFGDDGSFVIYRNCNAMTGSYRVSFNKLWFGHSGSGLVGCGYATADGQQLASIIASAVDSIFDDQPAVLSRPDDDELKIAADGFELSYRRA